MTVEVIRATALGDIPHGFLGRTGGVSEGVVAGLNVGSGSDDDPAAIAENIRRACEVGNVVGMDLVEFAPIKGFHAYDFTAAQLAAKMLNYALSGTKR